MPSYFNKLIIIYFIFLDYKLIARSLSYKLPNFHICLDVDILCTWCGIREYCNDMVTKTFIIITYILSLTSPYSPQHNGARSTV